MSGKDSGGSNLDENRDADHPSTCTNSEDGDSLDTIRRDLLKATGGLAVTGLGASTATATPTQSDLTRLWSVPLSHEDTSLATADTDGDGTDEIAVADKSWHGPTTYGILNEGEWDWHDEGDGAVIVSETGDVDGDGTPEVVFRSKVYPNWVRPYTHDGEYLWSGDHYDWPDSGFTADVDGDGRAEVMALSNNWGDLSVWDDDGDILWRTQDADLLESPFDFGDVNDDGRGEVLTDQPPNDDKKGIHVVERDGGSGARVLWSYGPHDPAHARFADLASGEPAVLVAYPDSGEVHAVDATGDRLWVEATGLTNATARVYRHAGGAAAAAWAGSELRFVGDAGDRHAFSTEATVQHVAAYDGDRLAAVTEDAIVVAEPGEGVVARHPTDRDVTAVAFGDVDGDDEQEAVIAYGDELTAYDLAGGETGRANVSIVDHRLVQTVENTSRNYQNVLDTTHDPDSEQAVDDPPLVAGRRSAAAFDLDVKNHEATTEPVDVEIVNESTGASHRVTILPKVLGLGRTGLLKQIRVAQELDGEVFGDGYQPDDFPVFRVYDGDTVTIRVGDQTNSVDGDAVALTAGESGTPIKPMPELRVGIMRVDTPLVNNDVSDSDYEQRVREIAEQLQRTYPVPQVKVYRKDSPVAGLPKQLGKTTSLMDAQWARVLLDLTTPIYEDSVLAGGKRLLARDGTVQEAPDIEINEFDVTLAIVPDGYFSRIYGESKFGEHHGGKTQHYPVAALARIGAAPDTALHEFGHHFLGHAFTEDFTGEGDHPESHITRDATSTQLDIDDGSFTVRKDKQSFMMSGTEGGGWADSLTWEKLQQGGFEPIPSEGLPIEGPSLNVQGWIDQAGEITLFDARERSGGVLSDVDDGGVILSLADLGGKTIDSWDFPATFNSVSNQGVNTAEDTDVTPIAATIPYPEDAIELTIVADGTTKTINTVTGQLTTLVQSIPDAGFTRNPDQRKTALDNKIAAVDRMIDNDRLRPAINKLRNDVRDKLAKWLWDDYAAAANQYTRAKALAVVDSVIDRLEANASQPKTGNDRKDGRGGK